MKKDKLEEEYLRFKENPNLFCFIRHPKLKCKICKKKNNFENIDVNCDNVNIYLDGYFGHLYRCPNCKMIFCYTEEELKSKLGEMK